MDKGDVDLLIHLIKTCEEDTSSNKLNIEKKRLENVLQYIRELKHTEVDKDMDEINLKIDRIYDK